MADKFLIPRYIVSGRNALKESMSNMAGSGKRALIVTDKMMVNLGNVDRLQYHLNAAGIENVVYSSVDTEPDDTMVREGADIYIKEECDFLIGLGGGSPMDTAKAIGIIVSNGGEISDYQYKRIEKEIPPVVTIPTTAGTGSEATCVAVIKNSAKNEKMMLHDMKLMASMAVVDPVFTMTVPPEVTVNTGADALCHAIESYTSRKSFSMSRIYSVDAIKKIYNNLPVVHKDGSNAEARGAMAEASLEAGIAFSNSSVSIVHGMSRPIGALFHIPHGLSNAILLKICLPYLKDGSMKEMYQMAVELDIYNGKSVQEGAELFVEVISDMLCSFNIPSLAELSIDKNEFFESIPKMVKDAVASGSPQNCKNIPSEAQISALYTQLWL